MDYCPRYTKVAYAQTGAKTALFARLRCKQWSCEFCAKKNASIWRAHLKDKIPTIGVNWWFITLTAPENKRTRDASLKAIRNAIDALLKRIRRVFGDDIEYVRTYEKHPTSDAVHAHMIMHGLTPFVAIGCSVKLRPMAIGVLDRSQRYGIWSVKSWFKINCRDLGMGYMIDVQRLEGDISLAVWYVTKYLTKALQDIHEPYLRHVQTSKGIGGPKNEKEDTWKCVSYITVRDFPAGTKVTDLNTGDIIDNNYWEVHSFYPRE